MALFNAIGAGLAGGAAMALWSVLMRTVGFSHLSLLQYLGRMFMDRPSGRAPLATGAVLHLVISVLVGFVYALLFELLWDYGSIFSAVFLGGTMGLVHWGLVGLVLPGADRGNEAVRRGSVPPLGRYAIGYGGGAALTFLLAHVIYGVVFGLLYGLLSMV